MPETKGDGKWHIGIEDTFEQYMNSFTLLPGDYGNEEGAKTAAAAKTEELKGKAKGGIVWDQVHIVRPDGSKSKYRNAEKIPVFVWKKDPGLVGTGIYRMGGCFSDLGAHVSFTVSFFVSSKSAYLEEWAKAVPCDRSCRRVHGQLEDFSEEGRSVQYLVKPIVDAAMAFKK